MLCFEWYDLPISLVKDYHVATGVSVNNLGMQITILTLSRPTAKIWNPGIKQTCVDSLEKFYRKSTMWTWCQTHDELLEVNIICPQKNKCENVQVKVTMS